MEKKKKEETDKAQLPKLEWDNVSKNDRGSVKEKKKWII